MNREQLYSYMRNPTGLTEATLGELQLLADTYPYCSAFSFLFLYNLAIVDDVRFAGELKRRAHLLPDRKKLFRMVRAHRHPNISITDADNDSSENHFELIDSFLGEMRAAGADLPNELSYGEPLSASDDYFASFPATNVETFEEPMLSLLHPSVKKNSMPPSPPRPTAPITAEELGSREESLAESGINEELFTETLAKIYIEQKRYDKALRILQAIHLNYPEKNRYFADQIRFLEKLISNNQQKT